MSGYLPGASKFNITAGFEDIPVMVKFILGFIGFIKAYICMNMCIHLVMYMCVHVSVFLIYYLVYVCYYVFI